VLNTKVQTSYPISVTQFLSTVFFNVKQHVNKTSVLHL